MSFGCQNRCSAQMIPPNSPVEAAAQVGDFLSPKLASLGFERRGNAFFQSRAESILIIDVQTGDEISGPYINLGVHYTDYGSLESPQIGFFHVRTRLGNIVTDPLHAEQLLKEKVVPSELFYYIETFCLSWLDTMATVDGAKNYLSLYPEKAAVSPQVNHVIRPKEG